MKPTQIALKPYLLIPVALLAVLTGLCPQSLQGQDHRSLLDILEDPTKAKRLSGPVTITLSPDAWVATENARFRVEPHLGRESLFLNGRILFPEVSFLDGIIEVDIAPNVNRSFAGIIFRIRPENETGGPDRANFEEVYIRLHKSGMPDAIQYIPIYNGQSTWQLYREYQSAREFKRTDWTHLKIVVAGEKAEIYLDDDSNPTLVVDRLRQGYEEGSIGLFALFGNRFANFQYTPFEVTDAPLAQRQKSTQGIVEQWALSPPMPAIENKADLYPGKEELSKTEWHLANAEPSGLLPISMYIMRGGTEAFEQNPDLVAWTRVNVESSTKQLKKLFFDYSDKAVVFLNGNPVYAGNNAFRSKGILERGDLSIDGNAVFLDLKKGNNELLVAVTERANGWGLMARFDDLEGIEVRP